MKKYILVIFIMIIAIVHFLINQQEKTVEAVSIIGGADGPTSIFIAGTLGDDFSIILMLVGVIVLIGVIVFWKRNSKNLRKK